MGYYTFNKILSSKRSYRLAMLSVSILAHLLLSGGLADAQSTRNSARAGSGFTGQGSSTSRRPYRRRQAPVAPPADDYPANDYVEDADFDYRLDAELNDDGFAEDLDFSPAGFCSKGCDCGDCADSCGGGTCCDDSCCGGCCEPSCGVGGYGGTYGPTSLDYYPTWFVGFEWSIVKPRFSENVAYTSTESDIAASFTNITENEFDYDLELTPRVWLEGTFNDAWGWRVTYWQFDHAPASTASGSPNNSFGQISHPDFAEVDISANDPAEVFTATSELDVFTIDVEALKYARINRWQFGLGGGVRYASTEQGYFATLNDGTADIGTIDFSHELDGFGPTFSVYGARPLIHRVQLVCSARGSVLFGDGSSRLSAVEDTPSNTTRVTNRDDLMPIGEARLGLEWLSFKHSKGWQFMLTSAMEGQVWGNAGSASSETGDLGFFGFNFGLGVLR